MCFLAVEAVHYFLFQENAFVISSVIHLYYISELKGSLKCVEIINVSVEDLIIINDSFEADQKHLH